MMSIFPPWDPRAKSMQRWRAGDKYNVTVVLNAQRVFSYTEDKQGMYINNTGSITIPSVLPIQLLCDQIYLITGEGQGFVLFSSKYSKFNVVGLLGGKGSDIHGESREGAAAVSGVEGKGAGVSAMGGKASSSSSACWGDISPGTKGGKRSEPVLGMPLDRQQAEDRAKGIRQLLWSHGFHDPVFTPDLFSAWSERVWICAACGMPNACGFLICLSCKALPLFQEERSGMSFSPVAQAYLRMNAAAINKERAKPLAKGASPAAAAVPGVASSPVKIQEFTTVYLARVLAHGGTLCARSFRSIVHDRVRTTINFQMKWMFNWYEDLGLTGAQRGLCPWFQGPAGGSKPYVPPWNPKEQNWPTIDECGFDAAEYSVAKAVRDTLIEFVYSRRTTDRWNIFHDLDPTWDTFKTALRRWHDGAYEYLSVRYGDVDMFDKAAASHNIADRLICDITEVADPNARIGNLNLKEASPFCQRWVEGVFIWLKAKTPGKHQEATLLDELMRRASQPGGDVGPPETGKGKRGAAAAQPRAAASWGPTWWDVGGRWGYTEAPAQQRGRSHPWRAGQGEPRSSWE